MDAKLPEASRRFEIAGRGFLVSSLYLEGAQDWRVAILVPEDHYLGDLQRVRRVVLATSIAVFLAIVGVGAAAVRSVQSSLGRMEASAARMRDFDFTPAATSSPFRDVRSVMQDLEQAKTALRAMGKYVPIDLVRQLYRSGKEPVLGGELRNVTLMFTDIRDFTTMSERLPPGVLAEALGRYLQAMTSAIHANGGTVDKYIGDAVMALWNAPEPRPGHATLACRAALACLQATRTLCCSPAWDGLPAFHTRIGLHRADVMVGHFGAPDRISYTALGDGVNLASRLEGLNKAYGTTILASQDVRDSAGEDFAFRLVDLVAVKGKTVGVHVHELLGLVRDLTPDTLATARVYEQAFEAYRQGRFAEAADLLEPQPHDPPSSVLKERCRRYQEAPPPDSWDGTYAARQK